MIVLVITLISILILFGLYYMMCKFDKYRNIISVIFAGICVTLIVVTNYLYVTVNNESDIKYLRQIVKTISDDFDIVNADDVEDKSIDYIVRYLSTNVLNNAEVKSINLETVSDMFMFADKYRNAEYVSDWVRCYGKYIGWCLAEYSIDPDADAYWEMKYKSSDKVASYNYGLLVSYKTEGFFIKYAPSIAFYLVVVQLFAYILWIILTIRNFYNKWRNKGDLQK